MILLIALGLFGYEQTWKVYEAQKALDKSPEYTIVSNIAGVRRYVMNVYADPWMKKTFPQSKMPQVILGKFQDKAYSQGDQIGFPITGGANYHVLHEIAHQIVPDNDHEKEFATVYLYLVAKFMGKRSYAILKKSYDDYGVDYMEHTITFTK